MKEKSRTPAKKTAHTPVKKLLITTGSVIILILAAITFIFLPAASAGAVNELPPIGSYDGKKIEYIEGSPFANRVENYSNQMEANGQVIDGTSLYSVMNEAFTDTVMQFGFEDAVKKSGYIAPESRINREMLPIFYDTNGVYSARIFRDTPDSTKIELQNQIESDINYNLYIGDINGLKTTANEIEFIDSMNKNQRSFDMVSFSTTDYPKEEVAIFGNENTELFTAYDMDVITLNTLEEANQIAAQIKNNELTFLDALSEYSINQYGDEAGKLKNNLHYQLKDIIKVEDSFTALTQLESGTISDAVETATGFSVFAITGVPKSPDFTNATTTDMIYDYMTIYEAGMIEDYYINIAKDFISQSLVEDFDTVIDEFGLEKIEVPAFPINYGGNQLLAPLPSTSQLASVQTNQQFFETAFSLTKDELSEPIVMGSDIIVLRLKEEVTSDDIDYKENIRSLYTTYYIPQFDSTDIKSHFMESDKVENNLIDVFFTYFL